MKQVAPEVKDVTEGEIPGTGQWHQKFTLFMPGDPVTEQPFDRTLGEQSMLVPFDVASTRNGDAAMKARPTSVMWSVSLVAMWGNGLA
jgi:hypothetical protein